MCLLTSFKSYDIITNTITKSLNFSGEIMEDKNLKEKICMERVLPLLDDVIENNSELVANLGKLIDLQNRRKIHKAAQVVGHSVALFFIGVSWRILYDEDLPNDITATLIPVLGSTIIAKVAKCSNVKIESREMLAKSLIGADLLDIIEDKDIEIENLSVEEKENLSQMAISTILKDRRFKAKIKKLRREARQLPKHNGDDEMI